MADEPKTENCENPEECTGKVGFVISEKTFGREFVEKVKEISGENIDKCMQCGTCSGGCPMIEVLQITPRGIMHLSALGQEQKIAKANTIWMCASCNTCAVRCPRGIDIPKVMEAMRQIFLRKNVNYIEPNQIPDEVLEDMPQIVMVSCFRKHTA
jgi:heterodisulfide reductase subunit C